MQCAMCQSPLTTDEMMHPAYVCAVLHTDDEAPLVKLGCICNHCQMSLRETFGG